MGLLMGLMMGLLGGPAFAFAVRSKKSLTKFEEPKRKFECGQGTNPELGPFGPHKSFAHNAIMFGALFFIIGNIAGGMAG